MLAYLSLNKEASLNKAIHSQPYFHMCISVSQLVRNIGIAALTGNRSIRWHSSICSPSAVLNVSLILLANRALAEELNGKLPIASHGRMYVVYIYMYIPFVLIRRALGKFYCLDIKMEWSSKKSCSGNSWISQW